MTHGDPDPMKPADLLERLKADIASLEQADTESPFGVYFVGEDLVRILTLLKDCQHAIASPPLPPQGETDIERLARAWADAEWRFTHASRRFANSAYSPNSPGNVEIDAAYNKARQDHDTARMNLLAALQPAHTETGV